MSSAGVYQAPRAFRVAAAVPTEVAVAVPAERAGAAMATSWRIPALHGAFARQVADSATERAYATEATA